MRRIVDRFGSKLAINEELKVVSPGNDADVIPLPSADVFHCQCAWDPAGLREAVLVDHQPCTTGTGIFLAPGKVKTPRAEDMRTDADVTKVGVAAFEGAFAARVRLTAYLNSRVALIHPSTLR